MTIERPITEEDLHAYVDAVLEPARLGEVEAYLKRHPEVATRVAGYARQAEQLRAAFAPIAREPVPAELNLAHLIEARHQPSRLAPWRAAAAAILLVGFGAAGGWSMRGQEPAAAPSGIVALAQEAAYNFSVYGADHVHPVAIRAAARDDLVSWLSSRLQTPVMVPDLSASGYRFMGGSLVATAHGPAGMLMYDNDHGIRFVMLVRPMETDKNVSTMVQSGSGAVAGFSWASNGIGYSVVGAASPDILHPLANQVRAQIERGI
jgi:anti-sigma factor RsiW